MPSTKLYIVYAAAGIATFAGSVNGLPSISYQLNIEPAEIAPTDPYRARDFVPTTYFSAPMISKEKQTGYPKTGKTMVVSAKAKLNKEVPALEKEKYNFELYEG